MLVALVEHSLIAGLLILQTFCSSHQIKFHQTKPSHPVHLLEQSAKYPVNAKQLQDLPLNTLNIVMSFLSLPAEIRLQIYGYVFAPTIVLVEAGMQEQKPSLIPAKAKVVPLSPCSGQLIRTCRLINQEAKAMLYARVHFVTLTQGFAGILPSSFTSGMPFASQIKHLTWQLNCDFMKHHYSADMAFASHELRQLDSLELRCQAENWKDSFCGEWVDREAFVRGRNQMIAYAQELQTMINEGCARKAWLVEDRAGLGRGRVVLKLTRSKDAVVNGLLIE